MLVSRSRDKLINAILFFAERTRALGKIKLFKLLYLLDFEHFRKTGRPVTHSMRHISRRAKSRSWTDLHASTPMFCPIA